MAELVTSVLIGPLVSMVKDKVFSYLQDQYKVMEGMEEQREILKRKLLAILDIIEDAEEKAAHRPGVRAWLKELRKVSYAANDVFDEFKYEALARAAKKMGHQRRHNMLGMDAVSLFPAYNPIVFRHRMGKKLQKIVQDIEALVAEMDTFGFRQGGQASSSKPWRQTDPVMNHTEKDIVSRSRNKEKEEIVNILVEHTNNVDLLVLPIVGMGGLGKTTFVQLIYSDPEIKKHFQFQKWCCVSDDFDVGNIARSICSSTEQDSEKILQELQKKLSGNRCLIVLDDVWNEDVDKWEKLNSCLQNAGTGSAILTTTRNAEVAQIMSGGKVQPHNLANLGDEFLKEILERRSFISQKQEYAKLKDVINEIVKRCRGSPLAAKAIGSMLRTKTSKDEWTAVLNKSSICNTETEILSILKLSYDNLPLHMKPCFAFCAVFPKDYEIDVEDLIQLWMANDYLPLVDDVPLETIGRDTFEELAWRSFFEDAEQTKLADKTFNHFQSIKRCKIHDLMHDIALSVLGEECTTITDWHDQKKLLTKHSRHAFLSDNEIGTHLIDFMKKQAPTLQTLSCPYYAATEWTLPMPKCKSLRVLKLPYCRSAYKIRPRHLQHLRHLDLSKNFWIKQLSEEISILYNLQTLNVSECPYYAATEWTLPMPKCKLKLPYCRSAYKIRPRHLQHLRHLDLSKNFWIKQLSEEISILYNLQTLNVSECGRLRQLPRGMKHMVSLRHIYTEKCRSLEFMPPDLGRLTSLQILTYFVAGASSGCSTIGELQNLDLGGKLMLSCLENVTEAQAKAASLGNKKKLRRLSLKWSSECREEPVTDFHNKVLDALKPYDELEKLRIVGYKSTSSLSHPVLYTKPNVRHMYVRICLIIHATLIK